jgi:hypothetical protein
MKVKFNIRGDENHANALTCLCGDDLLRGLSVSTGFTFMGFFCEVIYAQVAF